MTRKILSLALALTLLLSLPLYVSAEVSDPIADAVNKTLACYDSGSDPLEWADVLALYGAGIGTDVLPAEDCGELTGAVWALCAGQNPHLVYPDLFDALAGRQNEDGSFPDADGDVWINNHITAMLVVPHILPAHFFDRDKAEQWLLSQRLKDGSFAFVGDEGDPDLTAMALMALTDPGAIEAAKNFLLSKMTANGGFVSPWATTPTENGCTVAVVISGFAAQSLPIPEKMLQNLLSFQLTDGSFSYEKGGDPDLFTTQQALLALGDVVSGRSAYDRLPDCYFKDEGNIQMGLTGHVNAAARNGLIAGSDGWYRPGEHLTRAEAAAMLVKMLPIQTPSTATLTDVPEGAWYEYAARCVISFGVMSVSDGFFNPEAQIRRVDLAEFLTAALMLDTEAAMAAYTSGSLRIGDAASIAPTALPAVAAVMYEGIFSGDVDGNFMPSLFFTRDQLAAILNKIYA